MNCPLTIAWARVPPGEDPREVSRSLLRNVAGLSPDAPLMSECPRCRGPHGPISLGDRASGSIAYAGPYAVIAVGQATEVVGVDAELRDDPRRDAIGLRDVFGDGTTPSLRAWVRAEAVAKCDRRGLRLDLAELRIRPHGTDTDTWTARVPGLGTDIDGWDVRGPAGVVVSVARRPA